MTYGVIPIDFDSSVSPVHSGDFSHRADYSMQLLKVILRTAELVKSDGLLKLLTYQHTSIEYVRTGGVYVPLMEFKYLRCTFVRVYVPLVAFMYLWWSSSTFGGVHAPLVEFKYLW